LLTSSFRFAVFLCLFAGLLKYLTKPNLLKVTLIASLAHISGFFILFFKKISYLLILFFLFGLIVYLFDFSSDRFIYHDNETFGIKSLFLSFMLLFLISMHTKISAFKKSMYFILFIAFFFSINFISDILNRIFLIYIIFLSTLFDYAFLNIKKQLAILYSCGILFLGFILHFSKLITETL
jgi:hypothetical protein